MTKTARWTLAAGPSIKIRHTNGN